MSTRAIQFLKEKKISFRVIKYKHDEKGAVFAAHATGYSIEKTIKTLVVDLGQKKYCLALVPGDRQLSLKHLAKLLNVKRAVLVEAKTAEKITAYLVGGISPFGIKKLLPSVMEQDLKQFDKVIINGGQRGVMLEMKPPDIADVINCKIGKISDE